MNAFKIIITFLLGGNILFGQVQCDMKSLLNQEVTNNSNLYQVVTFISDTIKRISIVYGYPSMIL